MILNQPSKDFDKSNEEKRYWEYETYIKRAEGKCGTLIGANGGIFAIRRSLIDELPLEKPVTDDLFLTLSVLKRGRKFIYKDNAVAYEEVAPNLSAELKRKIRFSATNFQTLMLLKVYLKGAKFLVNYCYWSHKLIRWSVPIILLLLIPINIYLYSDSLVFVSLLYAQILFYLLAGIGFLLSKTGVKLSVFSLPYFFILTNYAILVGFIKFVTGKHSGIWQSTPR